MSPTKDNPHYAVAGDPFIFQDLPCSLRIMGIVDSLDTVKDLLGVRSDEASVDLVLRVCDDAVNSRDHCSEHHGK